MSRVLAVITTCRREPPMIDRAIRSVTSQTYNDWELLIVDDSPADYVHRDEVRDMAGDWSRRDSRISYIQHAQNMGVSAARNTALKFAESTYEGGGYEFIAYLDDDDEWLPEKLALQVSKLDESGEDTALVYCGQYWIDDRDNTCREVHKSFPGDDVRKELMRYNVMGSPSLVMMRTKYLAEIRGFDPELTNGEDWEVWQKLLEHHEAAYIDLPLVRYHVNHPAIRRYDAAQRTDKIIREINHVLAKNNDYYSRNKYAYWIKQSCLISLYKQRGDYALSFKAWLKAVSLQPLRVPGNIRLLASAWLNLRVNDKMRQFIHDIFPEKVYEVISSCYRKIMRKFF